MFNCSLHVRVRTDHGILKFHFTDPFQALQYSVLAHFSVHSNLSSNIEGLKSCVDYKAYIQNLNYYDLVRKKQTVLLIVSYSQKSIAK